jgi:acetylornithine deacetylase/succinyl-diaminopimelate desuccinylase-like protein
MAPVGFGPGDPYLAHTVDEHIAIDALATALEVNLRLALALPGALSRPPDQPL